MADVAEPEGMEGRKIVVAVDDGEESTFALQWCLRNIVANSAASTGARDTLVLVFARPSPPVFSAMDGTGKLWFRFTAIGTIGFPFLEKKKKRISYVDNKYLSESCDNMLILVIITKYNCRCSL